VTLWMLDTNTASYILKGNPPGVRQRLQQVPDGAAAVSAVTEAELRFGAARAGVSPRLPDLIEQFLGLVRVLPWDSGAARVHADCQGILDACPRRPGRTRCRLTCAQSVAKC
jgi:tRNA(fMet)-specific endonuclease VapC